MRSSVPSLSTVGAVAGRVVGPVMASWLREGRQPPQAVLRIIEGYLHRVARPTYVGTLSLYVGWSLARVEEMLVALQDAGVVVPLTPDEKKQAGFRSDANVWRLVGKPDPAKARW